MEVVVIGKYSVISGLRQIRRYNPDLIIAHWLFPAGFIARLSGYPFRVFCHGSDVMMAKRSVFWRLWAKWVTRKAAACFFVSSWLRDVAIDAGIIADPERAHVRSMPVNRHVFFPDLTVQRSMPPQILYVANFNLQKRHKLLIDALHQVSELEPALDWRAEFIGGHNPPDSLREQAKSQGIADRITWSEPVSQERLADKYRHASLVVHCGEGEGYGMSVAEARACRTPVLVLRSGGLPEATEGEGVVDDVAAFVTALRDRLRHTHKNTLE